MSIAEGALAALQMSQQASANQYNANRQREALKLDRERQDIQNRAEQERREVRGYRQVMGDIATQTGVVTEEQDWGKLHQERPDLTVLLSNQRPEYNKFTRADGVEVDAQLARYDFDEDRGTYIPMVKRFDTGEIVPMTRTRDESEAGEVVQITQQQFNDHLKSRWNAGITRGGLIENQGVLYSGAKTVNEYMAKALTADMRESALDLVGQDPQRSPRQKSEFYQVINDTNDIGALKQVYASLGGDADQLEADTKAAAEAQWLNSDAGRRQQKQEANDDRTPLQRKLNPANQRPVGRYTREHMSALGITDPEEYRMVSTVSNAVSDAGINSAGGRTGFLFKKQSQEDYERNTAAEDFYDRKSNSVAVAKAIYRDPRLKEEFDKIGPLEFYEKYGNDIQQLAKEPQGQQSPSQGGYTPEGTEVGKRPNSPAAPQLKAKPSFALTADNIKTAIRKQTERPTAEQTAEIGKFLNDRGIQTDKELIEAVNNGSVAPEDARFVAFVLGMTHKGNTSDKMALTQKLLNGMTYGDMEVGQKERATMSYNQGVTERQNTATRLAWSKHMLDIAQYDSEAGQKIIDDTETWTNQLFEKVGYLRKKDDGTYEATGADFDGDEKTAREIGRLIDRLVPKLQQARASGSYGEGQISPQEQAYLSRLNPALSLYLQSKANADEASILDADFYMDFFQPNPDGTVDSDLNRVRIYEKGPRGTIRSIAYVDEDGVNSQSVDMSSIQKEDPIVATLLAQAALSNGMID